MAFVEPKYSKSQVNKAGDILVTPENFSAHDRSWADEVLVNWRARARYPDKHVSGNTAAAIEDDRSERPLRGLEEPGDHASTDRGV